MRIISTSEGLGLLEGEVVSLLKLPYSRVDQLFQTSRWRRQVTVAPVRATLALNEVALVSAVSPTATVWITGVNYVSKARVLGHSVPTTPSFFLKASSAIVGPESVVPLPVHASSMSDFEGEVGVLISRIADKVHANDAWSYVGGIVSCNDVTARDLLDGGRGVSVAKSFPGFCPIGADLLTVDALPDRDDIGLQVRLNSRTRQQTRTSELIFSVPEIVSRLSSMTMLRPGDVVLTGSPSGSGQEDSRYLRRNDTVVVSVEGMLPLRNTFV